MVEVGCHVVGLVVPQLQYTTADLDEMVEVGCHVVGLVVPQLHCTMLDEMVEVGCLVVCCFLFEHFLIILKIYESKSTLPWTIPRVVF